MNIFVNGRPETIQPCSLADLVKDRGVNADVLVIEYNQQIVKQARWGDITLQENDRVELLSFVGGG